MSTKQKHGWSKRERELVRLWVAQISINRHRHQLASDAFAKTSFRLQLLAIVITAVGAVFSFVASYFNNDPNVVRILTICAGVLAIVSGLVAAIFASISPDTNSEKHRQTGIHYANYSNEIQAVLVEEHEELLPRASEFLARIRNGIHLLQSFGPSLDETSDSDLPSAFLLRDIDQKVSKPSVYGATQANLTQPIPHAPSATAMRYDMFERDDDGTATARAERRRKALEQLRRDKEELAARKKQIADEEKDLEQALAENASTLKKGKSSGELIVQSMPVLHNDPPIVDKPKYDSAPMPKSPRMVEVPAHAPRSAILHKNDYRKDPKDNIGSSSEDTDQIAHASMSMHVPVTERPTHHETITTHHESVSTHHESAIDTMRHVLGGAMNHEAHAIKMRQELRRRYQELQKAKEKIIDKQIVCETMTSELESEEAVRPRSPSPLKGNRLQAFKEKLIKTLTPNTSTVVTEQDVIDAQERKLKELGVANTLNTTIDHQAHTEDMV